jgi:pre-mRNA-processing factor 19
MEVDATTAQEAEGEQQSELQKAFSELTAKSAELSRGRKKRKMPEGLVGKDQFAAYECTQRLKSIHATTSPAIHTVSVSSDGKLLATAGADKSILIHALSGAPEIVATLKAAHTKRINSVLFHPTAEPPMLLSASSDKTIRIWQQSAEEEAQWKCVQTFKCHKGEVVALALLPVDWLFLSADSTGCWSLNSLRTGESLLSHVDSDGATYTRLVTHPDGLIFATGSADGAIKVWDLQSQTVAFECPERCGEAGVGGLAFSENGYYMATAGVQDGGRVTVWDLRKLAKLHTIDLADESYVVHSLRFDHSGSYLAVAGTDLR